MQLPNSDTKERHIAFLLTMAIAANILELLVPVPPFLPWLKPGFANAFTLSAIHFYGFGGGATVTILRTIIAGFITGQPITSVVIGGSGGIAATIIMAFLHQMLFNRGLVSLIGVSIAGAFTHSTIQIAVVNFIFVQNELILWQYPLLGPASIVTGTITALIANGVIAQIRAIPLSANFSMHVTGRNSNPVPFFRLFTVCVLSCLFLVSDKLLINMAAAIAMALFLLFMRRERLKYAILRVLPLITVTILVNMITESGRYVIPAVPLFTYEGISKGFMLAMRLVNIVFASALFINSSDVESILLSIRKKIPFLYSFSRTGELAIQVLPRVSNIYKDELIVLRNVPLRQKISATRKFLFSTTEKLLKTF